MSITATVENDTIKLPAGALPNGTQVRIEALPATQPQSFVERSPGGIVSGGRSNFLSPLPIGHA